MFHKKAAFKGNRVEDVKQKIKENRIEFRKDLNEEWKKLTLLMLQINPKKRPAVKDILSIRFIKEIKDTLFGQRNASSNLYTCTNTSQYVNKKSNDDFNKINNSSHVKTFKKQNNQILKYEEISDQNMIIDNYQNLNPEWTNQALKMNKKTESNKSQLITASKNKPKKLTNFINHKNYNSIPDMSLNSQFQYDSSQKGKSK